MTGCASEPEVVPAGPDTYYVSAGGGLGWTPASAPIRAKVYKAANNFCAKRGLVMMPVSVNERPGEMGRHTASMDLVFRALKPGDSEIKRPISGSAAHFTDSKIQYPKSSTPSSRSNLNRPTAAGFQGSGSWIDSVSNGGEIIILSDHSVWKVSPLDQLETSLWLSLSDVQIVPGDDASFPFRMINKDDKEVVNVQLLSR
jgi:hypothetical protein